MRARKTSEADHDSDATALSHATCTARPLMTRAVSSTSREYPSTAYETSRTTAGIVNDISDKTRAPEPG
jgi:hypothetical protein